MRHIEVLGDYANVQRPIAFLGGVCSQGDNWQRQVRDGLKELPKGTVLDPRPKYEHLPIDDFRPHELWATNATEVADVVGVWFPSGGAAQVESVLLLGRLLGRYALGGGPRRLVVGAGENYPFKDELKKQFNMAMERIEPSWRVQISVGMKGFIADMMAAIKYVSQVT